MDKDLRERLERIEARCMALEYVTSYLLQTASPATRAHLQALATEGEGLLLPTALTDSELVLLPRLIGALLHAPLRPV